MVADHPSVETEFSGALVEAMQTCLVAEDPGARAVPYLMSGGTDAKAWSRLGIRCFGFAPLRLPPDLDFVSLFHGVDERVPTESLEFGCPGPGPVPRPGLIAATLIDRSATRLVGNEQPERRVRGRAGAAGPPGSRSAVRQLLAEHAEYGGWELTRLRRYRDGTRDVWIRRKIIRVPLTV